MPYEFIGVCMIVHAGGRLQEELFECRQTPPYAVVAIRAMRLSASSVETRICPAVNVFAVNVGQRPIYSVLFIAKAYTGALAVEREPGDHQDDAGMNELSVTLIRRRNKQIIPAYV